MEDFSLMSWMLGFASYVVVVVVVVVVVNDSYGLVLFGLVASSISVPLLRVIH